MGTYILTTFQDENIPLCFIKAIFCTQKIILILLSFMFQMFEDEHNL